MLQAILQDAQSCLPALEAEILLTYCTGLSRTQLHTRASTRLTPDQQTQFQALLKRRLQHEPISYLINEREFWSLNFKVTPDTLIPRPETETLVERVLQQLPQDKTVMIADIGTGCGVIAIALSTERPHWHVTATDISNTALEIARQNAKRHACSQLEFRLGDGCSALQHKQYDAIVSNPPYIALRDQEKLAPDLGFEPQNALFGGEDGFAILKKIIVQAPAYLKSNGWLWLEHGYDQADEIQYLLHEQGFHSIETIQDLAGLDRVSGGQLVE